VNGAQALLDTLVDGGVDVCFANPGTSEMHFVAALDAVPGMRGVLALFEGVATGAADGYARIADRPAAVLLHLGPGLGNGLANLHNARRGRVPMVVVVGDHATYHKRYDAPLESDIDALAGTVSGWVRRTGRVADVASDTADAIAAAGGVGGRIATLILPADVSWDTGAQVSGPRDEPAGESSVAPDAVELAAKALRSGEPTVILVGGDATRAAGLASAARIAEVCGARLYCETFPTRLERGAGVAAVERLNYFAEGAAAQLAGAKHLVLAGAKSPVSFFAYPRPGPGRLPSACARRIHRCRGWSRRPRGIGGTRCGGTGGGAVPARPAVGAVDRSIRGRGSRRTVARAGDRRRRVQHRGLDAAAGHRGRAAP
jgi:acetolactate synthase-1/2/3 large subunit